jgi:L-malate glycosyltransferase
MAKRLKVLHIVFSLDTGGLESMVVNLCNNLDVDRFQPSICVLRGGGALESRVDKSRVDLFEIKRLWRYDPTLPFRIAKEIYRRNFDIVHTHSWGTLIEGISGALMVNTPMLFHNEHGVLEARSRNIPLQRWFWSKTDMVISVADALAEKMTKLIGFPRQQIHVIPNGVDTQRFQPRENGNLKPQMQFGSHPNKILFGIVARLVPVKNHLGLFHAFAQLRAQSIDADLIVAGDGELRDTLFQAAVDLHLTEHIHFLGDIANVTELLQTLDVFVLNSISEGMPITMLEAMACGLPVISTAVGSTPQLVRDGQNGILVKSEDINALATAMITLANNEPLRHKMGTYSRSCAEASFSLTQMVKGYADLYTETWNRANFN